MAAIVQLGGFPEEEAELVGFSKGEDDVFELGHEIGCDMIHELKCALVVRFSECVLIGEAMKRVTVYTTDEKTTGEEGIRELETAYIRVL